MTVGRNSGVVLLLGVAIAAGSATAQNQTPANSSPLPDTMQSIQDELNNHGRASFDTLDRESGDTTHQSAHTSGAVADATSCILHWVTTTDGTLTTGGDATQVQNVWTTTVPLKDIESIRVEGSQDRNRRLQSDITETPNVYSVAVEASKPVVQLQYRDHHDAARLVGDGAVISAEILFNDEEAASHVARSLSLAVRLCGGGQRGRPR
ncbi:MAG TPA: hypothetical protein VK828_09795 [Terriglobales bacterium]|jgi:hypothetical protein|nr:hypothetical protein [Terriglobales bacterium]